MCGAYLRNADAWLSSESVIFNSLKININKFIKNEINFDQHILLQFVFVHIYCFLFFKFFSLCFVVVVDVVVVVRFQSIQYGTDDTQKTKQVLNGECVIVMQNGIDMVCFVSAWKRRTNIPARHWIA